MIPFVGLADRNGNVVKRIDMPYYCNHYHANPDNTILVGDDVDDLVLIDISGDKAELSVLCNHKHLVAHPEQPLPPHLELGRQPQFCMPRTTAAASTCTW